MASHASSLAPGASISRAPGPEDLIVEVRNVRAFRGSTCVFDDLNLELWRGESTAILGPNGAGKSTLLKLITREIYPVHQPDSRIRLFGQDHWDVFQLRSRLGIVSHELQADFVSSATKGIDVILSGFHSSLRIGPHQHVAPEHRQRAFEVMEELGVAALHDKRYAAMSTGQQRRFLLGRALVHDPEALILDEPTSGLDLRATFELIERIRAWMRAGKTIILVTHHIHEIPPEIRRVVLLDAGRVVADGPTPDVLTSYNLSSLFRTPLQVVRANGFYQVVPGTA